MAQTINYGPALMDALGTNQCLAPNWDWARNVVRLETASVDSRYILLYARPNSTTFPNAASPWVVSPPTDPFEPRELLRRLKSETGLPWEALARSLGVSRRTVYNWLEGEPIAHENRARLTVLFRCVSEAVTDADSPRAASDRLLAPTADGVSLLTQLARRAAEQTAEQRRGEVSVTQLLTKPHSTFAAEAQTPRRRPLRRASSD